MDKRKAHVVAYTHWDREYRTDFESTRVRLVRLMDNLLSIMEKDPEYKSYLLDGQFTLIEDYLEVRPEKREILQKLAREGRLEVGPWFTLCDCAPINGESVIRNLQYGLKVSEEFGGSMKVGYNVFSFGQIAQLPQIYKGFDIDSVIFYKYMDPTRSKYHEFIWEGQDGSQVLASRLGKEARWNFFFAAHIPIVYNLDVSHKDWQYKWSTLGKVFHMAEPQSYGSFYEIVDPETSFHPECVKWGMERALGTVEGTAAPESVLFFDGTDFTEPHPKTPEYIKEINKQMGDEIDVQFSSLTNYIKDLKECLKDKEELDVVRGAMRDGPLGSVHTDSFSMHPELLRENSKAENALLRWLEPLASITYMLEGNYPDGYLEYIWKILFTCHAHDSIQGIGPGPLAEGVMSRLRRANIVLEELTREAMMRITANIDTSKIEDADYFMVVFNNSSFKKSGVLEAYIDLPKDANVDRLIIKDINNNEVQIQELSVVEARGGIYHPRSRNMPFYAVRYHVYFKADNIVPMGYNLFKLTWTKKNDYPYPHEEWDPIRIPAEDLLKSSTAAENDFIRVDFNRDGTFNLTNKKTGKTYKNQNYFYDSRDKGNTAVHISPNIDCIETTLGVPAKISIVEHGPLAVKFKVQTKMSVPSCFDFKLQVPSDEKRDIDVVTEVVLKKDSKYVEVTTTVDNNAKDHFLRVCFPTGLDAAETNAEGSFMVTPYPVKTSNINGLKSNELTRHASQLFFDISDGKEGLAVLNDAARDYEVFEDEDNTLAMSVVRGVRLRIACDNRLWMEYPGDESTQGMGKHTIHYALLPHEGDWDTGSVYESALEFSNPLRVAEFGKQDGTLPVEKSFLEINGQGLVLSAVKKACDRNSIIVRVFNPTSNDICGELKVGFDVNEAYSLKLNEQREENLEVKDNTINVNIISGKIYSLELCL